MAANPQRIEDFCVNIVRGMKPTQAALAAGYKHGYVRSDGPASLMRNPTVVKRIEVLRAHQARRLSYDVGRIIAEIEEVEAMAAWQQDAPTLLKAIAQKAEFLGLKPKDTLDVTVTYKPSPVPTKQLDLTVEEWTALWSPKEITGSNGHG